MRADPDHHTPRAWEPLRGIGYVVLLTLAVIAVGAVMALVALTVAEVLR